MKKAAKKPEIEWLDSHEMYQWLRLTSHMLRKYRQNKVLGFIKRGNKFYYNGNDVRATLLKNYVPLPNMGLSYKV